MKKLILLMSIFMLTYGFAYAQAKSTDIKTINGKKYYIHKVEKGQSLYAIAKTYNMDVNSILAENDDAIDGLNAGQELKIPFDSLIKTSSIAIDTNKYEYDKIQKGEAVNAQVKTSVSVHAQTKKSIKLYEKGNEFFNLKDYSQAIKFYDKAIKISSDYSKPHFARGLSYYRLEKYDLAMTNFNTVIELEPDSLNLNVYYYRGMLNEGFTKNKDAALKDYVKAAELNPKISVIFYRISILKFEVNDFIGANQAIENALKIEKEPAYLELEKKIKIELGIPFEVVIGKQIWTATNLNASKFRNGDPIPQAKTDDEWFNAQEKQQPAWCYYNNNAANGGDNGKLYNFYAVNDRRGLAPLGWRIPSEKDWVQLMNYLGGDVAAIDKEIQYKEGAYVERVKIIKVGGQEGTAGYNIFTSGFKPINGGERNISGKFKDGDYRNGKGNWWSSSSTKEDGKVKAFYIHVDDYWKTMDGYYEEFGKGFYVRCVKNQ